MKERVAKSKSLLILVGLLILLSSCSPEDQPTLKLSGGNLEITHLTGGIIDAHTLIAVRYKEPQVRPEWLGRELPVQVFRFVPEIKGKTYWQDSQTLVFEPVEPLYKRAQYQATLDMAPLLPEAKRREAPAVSFTFETQGQALMALSGKFVPTAIDQLDKAYVEASLVFAEAVTPDMLHKALTMLLDGEPLAYTADSTDGRKFTVKSAEIERFPHAPRLVQLQLAAAPLYLEQDAAREFSLPALRSPLAVERIEEEKTGDFSQLRIFFSEPLKAGADYTGYISIVPAVAFSAAAEGSSLVVKGEFRPGEKYSLRLFPGIESTSGHKLDEPEELMWEVQISDRLPAVEFVNSGMYMTTSSNQKLIFRTMNVARLRLQVKRVPEANLVEFFEENSFRPQSSSFTSYNRYRFQRYGDILVDKIIEIGREMNRWIYTELDLSDLITDTCGLYIVQLNFDENQALYFPDDYEYYDISSHTAARGRAVKHLLVSNIGITAKELGGKMYVFLTDLLTAGPITGARVSLKDGSGRLLSEATADESGQAVLKTNSSARYIEAHAGGQYAILALNSSQLNNSLFDVGGVHRQDGVAAFIYTERGVYRPGDTVHLAAIVRNDDNTFPANHPVALSLYNPLGRLVHEQVLTAAEDGFYTAAITTERTAPTGTWTAVLDIGGRQFNHDIRVEAIVRYRIRVQLDTDKEILSGSGDRVVATVTSEYLFGAPASGLTQEMVAVVEPMDVSFPRYQGFVFGNDSMQLPKLESGIIRGELDANGQYSTAFSLNKLENVPGGARLRIDTKVYESGGRFVPATKYIPIDVYPSYVGIQPEGGPDKAMGDVAAFSIVHVAKDGEPIPNSELEYKIYRYRYYWWWEYDSQDSFRRHFKSNSETVVIEQGRLSTNAEGVAELQHRLSDYGEILLEVKDPHGGHTAGYFFRAYWYGDSAQPRSADIVNLKLDKPAYYPGDTAYITLNTPARGRALVTVEKEGQLLYQRWEELTDTESTFAVPVEESCIPNAYVSVMVYQPFEHKDNDLPLRMYGIVPLRVISEGTRFTFQVEAPEYVRPEEAFAVKVQTSDGRPAQFTLAVVDEGILDITGFKTPDPWEHFFAKQRLLTKTYDNFSDVIDLYLGYLHSALSVGGGTEAEYREQRVGGGDAGRFEPVSIFMGPIRTDESGAAEVAVEVPNYIGSLRVMAVGAEGGRYGSGEQRIGVKAPVMVLPTLPRVIGPEDRFVVPVTVFALEEGVGTVVVAIDVSGPVDVVGPRQLTLDFTRAESQEAAFELQGLNSIGTAEITVSAYAPAFAYSNKSRTELAIRPYNPVIYLSEEKLIAPGETAVFDPPQGGVEGTTSLQLTVSSFRGLNLNHRIRWLVNYPYGCLEQVTSAVFPQLFLPDIYPFTAAELQEIDDNINAAVDAFREFQLANGGFSYWPNQSTVNAWATNYAGHFLLEAKEKGYHVPQNMLEMWVKYQVQAAKENIGDATTRAYRLYLLALAGSPQLSSMNYMRESELSELSNPAKFLLAGAYHLMGYGQIRDEILDAAGTEVADYVEFGNTFGSTLRDQAIILDVLTLVGAREKAAQLYDVIAREISSNRWYSTQATAYSLLALTKYIASVQAESPTLAFSLATGGLSTQFTVQDAVGVVPLAPGSGSVVLRNESEIPLFATLEWEGVPKRGELKPSQQGLKLEVRYLDRAGRPNDVTQVQQGDGFYILYRVTQDDWETIDQVALAQILPAGWEIENFRLSGENLPDWAAEYYLGLEDYVDIRDDRIMWFFTKEPWYPSYDFLVKINAVTVGEFYLPPTLLEAMYNNDYKVVTEGRTVEVLPR